MSDNSITFSTAGPKIPEAESKLYSKKQHEERALITVIMSSRESLTANELSSSKEQVALSSEEVKNLVDDINIQFKQKNINLSFSVDEELGDQIIKVLNKETDEVIRQIPSEDLLVLRKKLDHIAGILFDEQA